VIEAGDLLAQMGVLEQHGSERAVDIRRPNTLASGERPPALDAAPRAVLRGMAGRVNGAE
jgi:hypothetical protein